MAAGRGCGGGDEGGGGGRGEAAVDGHGGGEGAGWSRRRGRVRLEIDDHGHLSSPTKSRWHGLFPREFPESFFPGLMHFVCWKCSWFTVAPLFSPSKSWYPVLLCVPVSFDPRVKRCLSKPETFPMRTNVRLILANHGKMCRLATIPMGGACYFVSGHVRL